MVIKLKRLSEKICEWRIGRVVLVVVIFAGLVLFALGMGIAFRVSRMEGTLRDF